MENRTTIDGKYKERQGSQTKGEVSEERRRRAGKEGKNEKNPKETQTKTLTDKEEGQKEGRQNQTKGKVYLDGKRRGHQNNMGKEL